MTITELWLQSLDRQRLFDVGNHVVRPHVQPTLRSVGVVVDTNFDRAKVRWPTGIGGVETWHSVDELERLDADGWGGGPKPTCECGARKTGVPDCALGHSRWCPVSA